MTKLEELIQSVRDLTEKETVDTKRIGDVRRALRAYDEEQKQPAPEAEMPAGRRFGKNFRSSE